jgi:hypothetical protein
MALSYFSRHGITSERSSVRPPAVSIRLVTTYIWPAVPPESQIVATVLVFELESSVRPDGTIHVLVWIVSLPSQLDQSIE